MATEAMATEATRMTTGTEAMTTEAKTTEAMTTEAFTTQHSEPYKSSESTSNSQAIFLDSSATRLVPKIAFCSFVDAIRANLILA